MPETVLITGASSGIGLALAERFARDGSTLILTARRADELERVAKRLREEHAVEVHVFADDLSDPEAPERLFVQVRSAGLEVDVLVNNAGFGAVGWFWQMPLEYQRRMLQLNVESLMLLTWLFLGPMRERDRGTILNVASVAAFVPGPHMAVYYATKAFVLSFSEALHEEHRRGGVRVTCLCPGPTRTRFEETAGLGGSPLFANAMTVDKVADAGYRGLRRGRAIVVPGWRNKLAVLLPRFLPRFLVRFTTALLQPIPAPHKQK